MNNKLIWIGSFILYLSIGVMLVMNSNKETISDDYKKGFSDAENLYKLKFDSISNVLDSNYILTPKDWRKLVEPKIKKYGKN